MAEALPELVNSRLRVDRPYVRAGFLSRRHLDLTNRGSDGFVPVTWDQALTIVSEELQRVKDAHGNEAIYGGSYGWASAGRLHHAPSVLKRFLGQFGGYVDKVGNHSYGAALHIVPYILGRSDIPNLIASWPDIVSETQLLVMFGGANQKNTQIDSGGAVIHDSEAWFRRAKEAGLRLISISPSRADAPLSSGVDWLPIRPGTDTALMIGLACTLVQEGAHDEAFLGTYCVGFPEFREYLLGLQDGVVKNAAWAAEICGIDPTSIQALARRMASMRTLIVTSWSVQRAEYGEQPIWMTIALACILGQVGKKGRGFGFGLSAESGIASPRPGDIPRPTLDIGPNPVKCHIPVGRVTDMLLSPGSRLDYNGRTYNMPDIRLIYSAGGNPFHHNTNLNRFVSAWQQPETIIVHEPWWCPVAKHADIVLPATTTLERNDIAASMLSRFYIAMRKAFEPVGESRNDFDIFAELASRLGFERGYTEGRNEMQWLEFMYKRARVGATRKGYDIPDFSAFWDEGVVEFPLPDDSPPLFADFVGDPTRSPLNTPSGKIELYSKTIAGYGYADCPPHPTWLEPSEWLGSSKTNKFPLHLLSNQPAVRLHSQHDASALSRSAKIGGREALRIHPNDAHVRGIRDGDTCEIWNERGRFLAAARLATDLLPGVLQIATGAWYDPAHPGVAGSLEKHGNPNVVTNDRGTSKLSQAPSAQTVLVEIRKITDPPAVSAFDIPAIAGNSE